MPGTNTENGAELPSLPEGSASVLSAVASSTHEQFDRLANDLDAKARFCLVLNGSALATGALTLSAGLPEVVPAFWKWTISAAVLALLFAIAMAYRHLLRAYSMVTIVGRPSIPEFLQRFEGQNADTIHRSVAHSLATAASENESELDRKTACLDRGIVWTKRVFFIFIVTCYATVAMRIFS